MKIYKILAIINIILITISFVTGRLIKNNLKYYIGKIGTANGIVNLFLYISVPLDIILFIINI